MTLVTQAVIFAAQAHAQLFFQCLDLYRYSGLRIAQRLCRLGKTLELSRADQGIQLTNFHRRTPFCYKNF